MSKKLFKYHIKLQCPKCKGESFKLYDNISAPEKDVVSLAYKIASEGVVNPNAFIQECAGCGNIEEKALIYTEAK